MSYFGYIFYLGILYTVFSLLWFFIALLPKYILKGTNSDQAWEGYVLKAVQYYFLASLTQLKAAEYLTTKGIAGQSVIYFYLIGGIILYLYLLGKYERGKQWSVFRVGVSMLRNGKQRTLNNRQSIKYEPHIIGITIIFYLVALQYPELITNKINYWFLTSANDFYDTVIIKWILGVIGFFFMLSMVIKGVSTTGELFQQLIALITGRPYEKKPPKNPFEQFGNKEGGGMPFEDMFKEYRDADNHTESTAVDDDMYVDFEYVEDDEDGDKDE